jgi:hypothetical protein
MIERDQRPALASDPPPSRADSDPIQLSADAFCSGPSTNTANADNRIEVTAPKAAHAVLNAKPTSPIGITFVGSLVNEGSHVSHQWVRLEIHNRKARRDGQSNFAGT